MDTVPVDGGELEVVRRLVFAAGNLAIAVLETDEALVPRNVLEQATYVQALFGELDP